MPSPPCLSLFHLRELTQMLTITSAIVQVWQSSYYKNAHEIMGVHGIFKSGGHHELWRISLNVPQFLSFLVKLASRIAYSTQTFDLRGCETTTLDPVAKVDI